MLFIIQNVYLTSSPNEQLNQRKSCIHRSHAQSLLTNFHCGRLREFIIESSHLHPPAL